MPDTRERADGVRARRTNPRIILAFDYGRRRIGVAAGNLVTRTATGLATITVREGMAPWQEIDRFMAEFAPDVLVVGLPQAPDNPLARPGSAPANTICEAASAFAAELEARYGRPVETVDETLTSKAAETAIREARQTGRTRRRGKGAIDRLAACLIAEQWINEQPMHKDLI